ncbi:MAG: adenylosuccinate lyase [Candidatus Aminicenantes bacterium]|nr:adenylosuccinate lyase [Candidatus Aminicenantes bacterium]
MIERYTNPEMGSLWKDQNRYRTWLLVEIAVCEAWAKLGKIPAGALKTIKAKAAFDVERIDAIEKVVKHDIIAFLTSVNEKVGPDGRFIHMGLTSYDVVDTALSMIMRESLLLVRKRLIELKKILRREAIKHKKTVCMGRTHGIHAEPVTFGFKVLVWYEEIKRHLDRVDRAIDVISVGRISGSVGTYIHLNPKVEVLALKKLGLAPAPVSTQVLQRDRHAEVVGVLALVATSLEKFTLEIRHLQRSEVLELEEPFTKGQKGSSSMPHKKNPVRCERMAGLARLIRGNVQVALENIPLWHERDISHSSAERVILPDSFLLTDYMLTEAIDIIGHWVVNKGRMRANIDATHGLTFSQSVLLALTRKGLSREDAYQLVQRNSLKTWAGVGDFRDLAAADPDIAAALTPDELKACFAIEPYLEKIDYIFERVLSHEG